MEVDCSTSGDGDLYGLGVRLGLYFQWAAGFLLRNFNGSWKTISTVRMANNALGISISLATMINTHRGLSEVTDFLIVYYLAIALFYAESYNLLTKEDASKRGFIYVLKPDMPLLLQNLLFAVTSLFGGWFWIHGVQRAPQPVCDAKAAVIGTFDLNNSHWKVFAATFSISLGILFAFFFVVHLVGFWNGEVGRQPVTSIAKALSWASQSPAPITFALKGILRPRFADIKSSSSTSPYHFDGLKVLVQFFVLNIAGPLVAVSSVERIIRENHLVTAGISESSGQMIALITGITSFCMAVWELGKDLLDRKRALPRDITSILLYNSTKPMEINELREVSNQLSLRISQYEREDGNNNRLSIYDFRRPDPSPTTGGGEQSERRLATHHS